MHRIVDAHCHLQDPRLRACLPDVLARACAYGLTHICTCACKEDEWADFPSLVSSGATQIVPAFGLHPWYTGDASPSYLDSLRDVLCRYPSAAVGEIGLCKSKRGIQVPAAVQEARFRDQLDLAQELHRPVVLHCVAAHGKLLEMLASTRGVPHAILHSFSGSLDMVRSYDRLPFPVYYSFSAKQCLGANDKIGAILRAVPPTRLLLETDAPDQRPVSLADDPVLDGLPHNEPAAVVRAVDAVAAWRGCSPDELAQQVWANTAAAFHLDDA
ncbi:Aste57867_12245 [Aphanomyces stellatus]|uniref:Aste57867_12245 protein n=1 Tax=Aphanomyces stellatus TaxID=120398 RepID=A0A485KVH8_9STRA|nr:hypothetical protein As57867_012200 [Aphanomyces stellatus]VFT89099.1 Aste57867_12245 [Aphanomyces stellatus]